MQAELLNSLPSPELSATLFALRSSQKEYRQQPAQLSQSWEYIPLSFAYSASRNPSLAFGENTNIGNYNSECIGKNNCSDLLAERIHFLLQPDQEHRKGDIKDDQKDQVRP